VKPAAAARGLGVSSRAITVHFQEGPLSTSHHQKLFDRVRAEYLEMPGLRLKLEQVKRLCGVEDVICRAVLDALVEARVLCVKPDGAYARLTDGELPRPLPVKADLRLNHAQGRPAAHVRYAG
jgi:hypothetical protein